MLMQIRFDVLYHIENIRHGWFNSHIGKLVNHVKFVLVLSNINT
jgi:hypothetical protein